MSKYEFIDVDLKHWDQRQLVSSDPGIWYYLPDLKFFRSKWLAIAHVFSLGMYRGEIESKLRVCYDQNLAFSNYDWTVEPEGDWETMCVEKLKEYRDTHDFMTLMFSGGQDSNFLLHLCLENKIKLDEILIYRSNLPGFDNSYVNIEVNTIALPHTKNIDLNLVGNPKITVYQINDWKLVEKLLDYDYSFSTWSNLLQKTPMNMTQKLIQPRSNNSVILRGSTEPHIYYDVKIDKYYLQLWDTDNFIDGHCTNTLTPFFTNPKYPELHAKQCHLMLNYLRQNRLKMDSESHLTEYKDIMTIITRGGMHIRLNTDAPFFNKKSGNKIFTEKKSMHFVKELKKLHPKLFEMYMFAANSTIGGSPLIHFGTGTTMGKFYLE